MAQDLTPKSFKLKGLPVQLILTKFSKKAGETEDKHSFTDPKVGKFGSEVPMGFILTTSAANKLTAKVKDGMSAVTLDGERIEFPEIGTDDFKFGFVSKAFGWGIAGFKAKVAKYKGFKDALVDADGNRLQIEGKDAYQHYIDETNIALDNIFIQEESIPFTGSSLSINPAKFSYLPVGSGQSIEVGSLIKNADNPTNKKKLENLNVSLEKALVVAPLDISISWGKDALKVYTNFSLPSLTLKKEAALTPQQIEQNKELGRIAQSRREAAKLVGLRDFDEDGFDTEGTPSVTSESDSLFE
jgi:hypothetical protein